MINVNMDRNRNRNTNRGGRGGGPTRQMPRNASRKHPGRAVLFLQPTSQLPAKMVHIKAALRQSLNLTHGSTTTLHLTWRTFESRHRDFLFFFLKNDCLAGMPSDTASSTSSSANCEIKGMGGRLAL